MDVSCSFVTVYAPDDRLFNRDLGGGAILDVGCYSMSFARMIAGWVADDESVEPAVLDGAGHIGEGDVDDWAVATLGFDTGVSAHVRAGMRMDDDFGARIHGTEGHVRVPNPWTPGRGGVPSEMILTGLGHDAGEVLTMEGAPLFGAELDAVAESILRGYATEISVADSIGTMRCLDSWRDQVRVFSKKSSTQAEQSLS